MSALLPELTCIKMAQNYILSSKQSTCVRSFACKLRLGRTKRELCTDIMIYVRGEYEDKVKVGKLWTVWLEG